MLSATPLLAHVSLEEAVEAIRQALVDDAAPHGPGGRAPTRPTVEPALLTTDPGTGGQVALVDTDRMGRLGLVARVMLAAQTLCPLPCRVAVTGDASLGQALARAVQVIHHVRDVQVWFDDPGFAPDRGWRLNGSARSAIAGAQLVITCATGSSPVVEHTWLTDGAVIIGASAATTDAAEVDAAVLSRSTVVVDDVERAVTRPGPIRRALGEGLLTPSDLTALGDVLRQGLDRPAARSFTYYRADGSRILDAALVRLILAHEDRRPARADQPW